MIVVEQSDLFVPGLPHRKIRTVVCPHCGHIGAEFGQMLPEPDDGLFDLNCAGCGELLQIVEQPTTNLALTIEQGSYMVGTEDQLKTRLSASLSSHFGVHKEVWLRFPWPPHHDTRIDFVAVPNKELAKRFPFNYLGIEVKPEPQNWAQVTHALKQCWDYKECVISDQRPALNQFRGTNIPCVALYRGRVAKNRNDPGRFDNGTLIRLAGLANIGEIIEEARHGISLLISCERIWSKTYGVSDAKASWPTIRPFGST